VVKIEDTAYPLLSLVDDDGQGVRNVPISWVDPDVFVSVRITDIAVLTLDGTTTVSLKTRLPSAENPGSFATVKINIPVDTIDSYLELNFPGIPVVRL